MSFYDDCTQMVDCMLNIPPSPTFCCSNAFKTSDLADVMQHEEFGSKLALHEAKSIDEDRTTLNPSVENLGKSPVVKVKNKRKRARATKTSEEVERQRMTHIAVERNRRKQMNEHLQILRSLMPTSYVHRGDQASIVGGAIEFVRELEQLLQCLESVKRRQSSGDEHDHPSPSEQQQQSHQEPLMFPTMPVDPNDEDETAESKSCLADVEVKLSGFFGLIKILSERRPGQLIKNIAALEHLQLHILQTNVTTTEHNVVCSFSVKISGEARFTAEDIANSIQQILSSVHANQHPTVVASHDPM